jgi:hypothetical protein
MQCDRQSKETMNLSRQENSDYKFILLVRGFKHPRIVPFGTAPAASASEAAKMGGNAFTALADVPTTSGPIWHF